MSNFQILGLYKLFFLAPFNKFNTVKISLVSTLRWCCGLLKVVLSWTVGEGIYQHHGHLSTFCALDHSFHSHNWGWDGRGCLTMALTLGSPVE